MALHETGRVSHASPLEDASEASVRRAFGPLFAETCRGLRATLISCHPPMWVTDEAACAHELTRRAVASLEDRGGRPLERIDNEGAYVPQSKAYIDEPSELAAVLRDAVEADALPRLNVKVYGKQTAMGALDRLHVDRSRRDRRPMKLTAIVFHDSVGGTYFPFAAPTAATVDGVEAPTTRHIDVNSMRDDRAHDGWEADDGSPGGGLVVRSRPGRLLLFASSDAAGVPLYASLHQGVDDPTADACRRLSVVGWDGQSWEASGRHECLDHESITTRAAFFGRSELEESLGMAATRSYRTGEALANLERLARQRSTTIERLVRDAAAADAQGTSTLVHQVARRISTGMSLTDVLKLRHISSSAPAPAPAPAVIYAADGNCPVCFGGFADAPDDAGALACGHMLCRPCHDEMRRHVQLVRHNQVRCPSCRAPSASWVACTLREGRWSVRGASESEKPPSERPPSERPPSERPPSDAFSA